MITNHDHNTHPTDDEIIDLRAPDDLDEKRYRESIDYMLDILPTGIETKKVYARVLLETLLADGCTIGQIFNPNFTIIGSPNISPQHLRNLESFIKEDKLKTGTLTENENGEWIFNED